MSEAVEKLRLREVCYQPLTVPASAASEASDARRASSSVCQWSMKDSSLGTGTTASHELIPLLGDNARALTSFAQNPTATRPRRCVCGSSAAADDGLRHRPGLPSRPRSRVALGFLGSAVGPLWAVVGARGILDARRAPAGSRKRQSRDHCVGAPGGVRGGGIWATHGDGRWGVGPCRDVRIAVRALADLDLQRAPLRPGSPVWLLMAVLHGSPRPSFRRRLSCSGRA